MRQTSLAARQFDVDGVLSLLAEAAKGRSLSLTRRELRGYEYGPVAELSDGLRAMWAHRDECAGTASREILGDPNVEQLGHAGAWIDAGAVFEQFAAVVASDGHPDYVFCLDSWAAQLLSRARELSPNARWVYVSDSKGRSDEAQREYWERTEAWFEAQSFFAIVPREVWALALGSGTVEPPQTAQEIHLHEPGAWQWRRISRSSAPEVSAEPELLFLVRHSGSVAKLRVFLESLSRQDYRKGLLSALVLSSQSTRGVDELLAWFGLIPSGVRITKIDTSLADEAWKLEVSRALAQAPLSVVALLGDSSILPEQFARTAVESIRQGGSTIFVGVPISPEATAHIVTGNLDAVSNYESLLKAFGTRPASPGSESVRLVPTGFDGQDPGASLTRVLEAASRPVESGAVHRTYVPILELADLP